MSKNTVKAALTRKRRARSRRHRGWLLALAWLLVRFVSGRPLDGKTHSNCTFWSAGTRRIGYPVYLVAWRWWALAAGWQRLGLRLTAVTVTVLAVAGVVAL
ncbi:hypothetical protein ACTI_78310 [Actinoplanes sp. OR16]|uniref:hypothetical protein n=1 Tax=Actinoplanes sp. OR16 TaxID=946334 RepID=UPI000F6E68B1|nr:hypothetical protein [Actinoplanes sp. OR16]BBH71146.1 hypothetical protein ACTI_78310 [Actinoplanes sp. OR16]